MDCLVNDEFYDLWIFIALTLTNIGYIFTIFTEKFVNMCNGTCMYLEYEITVGKNRDKYIYILFFFFFILSLSLSFFNPTYRIRSVPETVWISRLGRRDTDERLFGLCLPILRAR